MSRNHNIYCISGLAADENIFQNLCINAPLHHVHWLQPDDNETFESYLLRLKEQIVYAENLILIGISFGGMVAQSLHRYLSIKKTIIISSIKGDDEKPAILKYRWLKSVVPLIIPRLAKAFPGLSYGLFGAQSLKEKSLLKSLIQRADNYYLRWSVQCIMEWDNTLAIKNLYHIHGTADKLFDINNIVNPIRINGGTHFAVYDKAEEISKIINEIIETP